MEPPKFEQNEKNDSQKSISDFKVYNLFGKETSLSDDKSPNYKTVIANWKKKSDKFART